MILVSLSLSLSFLPVRHISILICNLYGGEIYADVCDVMFQGRITVTGLLDREKGDMYTLTIVADDGGPKKDSTVVCFILNCVILSPFFSCATYLL